MATAGPDAAGDGGPGEIRETSRLIPEQPKAERSSNVQRGQYQSLDISIDTSSLSGEQDLRNQLRPPVPNQAYSDSDSDSGDGTPEVVIENDHGLPESARWVEKINGRY